MGGYVPPRPFGELLGVVSPPPGATWGALTQGVGLSQLVHALQASPAGQGLRLTAWNVRWLVSGRDQGPAKRECIRRWLDAGRVVALSETHWREADAAVWASNFPGAVVVASCAVPGPNGGPRCRCLPGCPINHKYLPGGLDGLLGLWGFQIHSRRDLWQWIRLSWSVDRRSARSAACSLLMYRCKYYCFVLADTMRRLMSRSLPRWMPSRNYCLVGYSRYLFGS